MSSPGCTHVRCPPLLLLWALHCSSAVPHRPQCVALCPSADVGWPHWPTWIDQPQLHRPPSLVQALQDQSIYFAVVRTGTPTKDIMKKLVNGFADRHALPRCMLRVGHSTQPVARCMLCVACCALHVVRCMLRVACCALHVARCMLRVACCALHVARCMLCFACCALHVVRCMLRVVRSSTALPIGTRRR
jgi:hypothetical protein